MHLTDTASYEIVLSAGSVDTAKLLMLSGIGARDELSTHGIDVVQDLPGVGRNLQDHSFAAITVQVREDAPGRGPTLLGKPSALEAARDEFEKHGTGPFTRLCNSQCMAFLSADDELQATDEFKALPSEIQDHLRMPTVPAWELITGIPPLSPNVDLTKSYLTFLIVNMLPQSTGTVSLSSADPHDAPICDPNVLSHAYDRVNLMKNVKTIMKLLQTPGIAKHVIDAVAMPTSESNDDVWKFISETAGAAWHQCGTVKMGNAEDPMACVDSRFRVRGIAGLRAADNSVPPFIPCCHTQSIAYLMGQTCAEKLIEEYYLD